MIKQYCGVWIKERNGNAAHYCLKELQAGQCQYKSHKEVYLVPEDGDDSINQCPYIFKEHSIRGKRCPNQIRDKNHTGCFNHNEWELYRTCTHLYEKGIFEGEICGDKVVNGHDYCAAHSERKHCKHGIQPYFC